MGKRKLLVATSADEDDEPKHADKKQKLKADSRKQPDAEEDKGDKEEVPPEDAKPVGDVIKSVGKGKKRRKHYNSFEYKGNVYDIEDPVLITPEDKPQMPYVAIIKEITQEVSGNMMITGQWFYRPEEAEKKGGGTWQGRDTRELFYSFHLDNVPAESVMHKCVVHFIPLNKKIPTRQQHPGFIVQKVYDAVEKRLWKLTDKDYEVVKQQEIDVLVQKTINRIGELENIEPENISADNKDQTTSKRSLGEKNTPPIDVSKNDDDTTKKPDHPMKTETPGRCTTDVSEYRLILSNFNALTGDSYRDKWLDKLLEGIQTACNPNQEALTDDKKGNLATSDLTSNGNGGASTVIEPKENNSEASEDVSRGMWPDAAVQAITTLEKASHDALGSDFQKYNKKMKQLVFNLKNYVALSRRLLNKELDPVVIVNMSHNELKHGLTAEEKTTKEPEESKRVQMTDARCSRCTEKKVCVAEIIHASHGDRYQLECMVCGYTGYASHDAISSLTIDTPSVAGNVGTAPWATAKSEDVERKKPVSPWDSEKPDVDSSIHTSVRGAEII